MLRDMDKFKQSLSRHHKWQLDYFNTIKQNLVEKVNWWNNPNNYKYSPKKATALTKEILKLKFQFNKKEATINYGFCIKLTKDVSFLPNVCQLDTQECFKNRKTINTSI